MSETGPDTSVRRRFGDAAGTYDGQIGVQPVVAAEVARLCARVVRPGRIVEVGCGTGALTARLADRFPEATIEAVDFCPEMLARARHAVNDPQGRIRWLLRDARELDCAPAELIASSSALHWLVPLGRTFAHLAACLRPGGFLCAGLMVAGTLGELHAVRLRVSPHKPPPFALPESADVRAMLRENGFALDDAWVETFTTVHESAASLFRALHAQGVTGGFAAGGSLLNRSELRRTAALYDRECRAEGGGVRATYRVLFVVARRVS